MAETLLGNRLKCIRKSKHMTLTELAKVVGCSISHLSNLETGRKKSPGLGLVDKLAKVLDTDISYFISDDNDIQTNLESNAFQNVLPKEIREFIIADDISEWIKLWKFSRENNISPHDYQLIMKAVLKIR